ncbi:hypothetical protein TWF225_003326 [Orbilia oligospora]|uniref:Uncharacterized protein n=1 Tax=Orbilia oligospora TaxID=2813651 RepID=A0A7C8P1Y9_ORBOL|nr:hypothetical protein TWF751_009832 [Orbilia oligospora]KAF3188959.1 hypothetical protein TWF225_003326 [Orbilia oligospora]KAF3241097.1 hypothetical protein TWF128_011076 [Orbilia oligospora]KAF3271084.1 hypothetical protein TWF217_005506 [Orbilia oligospora]KAF3288105.1 hypothetical protein TWF132_007936 [Orbilia oligospora]
MQQEQHATPSTPANTMEKRRATLDELKEYNLSGVLLIPNSTSHRYHSHDRGNYKYKDKLDEDLERGLAEIELNVDDSVQQGHSINNRNRMPKDITILSRPSEKPQNSANSVNISNYTTGKVQNTKYQRSNNIYTPRYQGYENTNFNDLSKTQQRKLRDYDRLARVQQRIDSNQAYEDQKLHSTNAGLREDVQNSKIPTPCIDSSTSTPLNAKNSDQLSSTLGSKPVPKFTIMQRPSRSAKTPSPVPPLVPPSVDAWLDQQSTSGPWNPLKLDTKLSPRRNRERRRERFQQIQSETDTHLAQLDGYQEKLEMSIKED